MSVDVSPDGRWIVFDLLASVYRMPAAGGAAESLTLGSGIALNFHPRLSPDGQSIAFISDRGGQNNLWVMDADGRNPRAISPDPAACLVEPAWAADGRSIFVRRQGSCHRGNGASAGIWKYALDGTPPEEVVAKDVRAAGWPWASADGQWLYFHYAVCPPYHAGRNDLLRGCMQIKRLDLRTKALEDVTRGEAFTSQWSRASNGGAIAPSLSPDGRWLAFGRRIADGTISFKGHRYGPRTALWLRDLETGAERVLMDPIESDLTHGLPYAMHLLPTPGWARDSQSIVLSQGGKIRRVRISDGQVSTIPFSAVVHRSISEMAHTPQRIADDPQQVRFPRWSALSPRGDRVAFEAVGKIWLMDRRSGATKRLTAHPPGLLELSPAWSPDGNWVAFATWDEDERGHVWKAPAAGGAPVRLTEPAGEYVHPVWSPDGRELVVSSGSGATLRGETWASNPWYALVRVSADGGAVTPLVRARDEQIGQIVRASFGADRVFYLDQVPSEGVVSQLTSVKRDGSDRRVHATFRYADEAVVSPDGRWLAFAEGDNVYVSRLPPDSGNPARIDRRAASSGVTQVTQDGGLFPRWLDSRRVELTSGAQLVVYDVESGTRDAISLGLKVPRRIPKGTIALTGARLVTMEGARVVESGSVVVSGNRITCVGSCDIRVADKVIDAKGKTIIPGLIDTHAHRHVLHQGIVPPRNFEASVYLAYGITSTLDPATWAQNMFPTAEAVDAGTAIGPRTFGTGDVFAQGDGVHHNDLTSYQVTEHEVRRRADAGAISLKSFHMPRREQRQWITEAARRQGLMVTGEGGSLEHDLSMVMDGQSGWEHDLTYVPVYSDVARFFGQAKATYSITLMTDGPGPLNEEYFWQREDVWKDEKQRDWLPWSWLVPHTRSRWLRPETDYTFPILAQGLADIIADGGYGGMGGHGDQPGLGSHWEIWMMASAMGARGALEIATRHGAHALARSADLGSLSVGKLADLVVLDANPLDDIRNTLRIHSVMLGGVLRDGRTLDEMWPEKKPFGRHYWTSPEMFRSDERPATWWDGRP